MGQDFNAYLGQISKSIQMQDGGLFWEVSMQQTKGKHYMFFGMD